MAFSDSEAMDALGQNERPRRHLLSACDKLPHKTWGMFHALKYSATSKSGKVPWVFYLVEGSSTHILAESRSPPGLDVR